MNDEQKNVLENKSIVLHSKKEEEIKRLAKKNLVIAIVLEFQFSFLWR